MTYEKRDYFLFNEPTLEYYKSKISFYLMFFFEFIHTDSVKTNKTFGVLFFTYGSDKSHTLCVFLENLVPFLSPIQFVPPPYSRNKIASNYFVQSTSIPQ